jgi:(E)-4-hydroxy-3-methyl-but-2-enyl pyrophosphate reductase
MKILIAKNAGFCMGVRRAVEMVLDAPNKHENPICTFGPLIHNPQVLDLLREKEISILEQIPEQATGTILIRAHGVPPQTKQNLKKAGYKIIDATCPRVIKVQTIIRMHANEGYASIIIGDKDHPEVIGLLGYAEGKGFVVDNLDDLNSLPSFEKAIIVAQTTQNTLFFEEIKQWATNKFPHYKIFDTICDSTIKRQAEIQDLANSVVEIRNDLLKFQKRQVNLHIILKMSRKLMSTFFLKPNVSGLQPALPRRTGLLKKFTEHLRPYLIKRSRAFRGLFFPSSVYCFLPTSMYPSVPDVCAMPV